MQLPKIAQQLMGVKLDLPCLPQLTLLQPPLLLVLAVRGVVLLLVLGSDWLPAVVADKRQVSEGK